jgi:hypothetical protein
MSTLDELMGKAKDDETKELLRQVADLSASDARKVMEGSHAALRERDRQHADALKSKDRQHADEMTAKDAEHSATIRTANARIEKLADKAAILERTVATQNDSIVRKDGAIAKLREAASNAQGLAVAGGFTSVILGFAAFGRRR